MWRARGAEPRQLNVPIPGFRRRPFKRDNINIAGGRCPPDPPGLLKLFIDWFIYLFILLIIIIMFLKKWKNNDLVFLKKVFLKF